MTKSLKCGSCGQTISYVTYGAFGATPRSAWRHVGNRFQHTDCKKISPPKRCSTCEQRKSSIRYDDLGHVLWRCNDERCVNHYAHFSISVCKSGRE
jgi:hypothetical protein